MSNYQKNGNVSPPFQIFLTFNKHIKIFMLIPTNLIFLKLVKVLQSHGPYKKTTLCDQ